MATVEEVHEATEPHGRELEAAEAHGQQHPIRIYFLIWGLLFLFSLFSYLTDFLDDGLMRWGLILLFMFLKAGFIVAIFMHMAWERLALIFAILGPPLVLLVLIGLMVVEGDYTLLTRIDFFSEPPPIAAPEH
ncbi:MAG TPA: cytochrome C oxidase subunit IV family protein [Gammaproteobacteria bacterium]